MSGAYRVFGLNVRSEIDLPELAPSDQLARADVTISVEPIDSSISAPGVHAIDGDLVFVAEGVARYHISGGNRIVVDPSPGSPERNVRLFLLGSAFGALLHQRGLLPLHANAVEIGGKAVAFMGESGAGKSTLAAWFHDNGYRVLADDVTVVRFGEDSRARVAPGLPRLRLWRDALEMTRRDPEQFKLSYTGELPYEKFDVPLHHVATVDANLAAIYVLQRADHLSIRELTGADAVEAVFENTYRGSFVTSAGTATAHWSAAVRLVRSTPVFGVRRPWALDRLDEDCNTILKHALRLRESVRSGDLAHEVTGRNGSQ